MRNIDDILAAAHKAMTASVYEAYEAGRAHTATELKSRMAAFIVGLVAEAKTAALHTAPHTDAPCKELQQYDTHST